MSNIFLKKNNFVCNPTIKSLLDTPPASPLAIPISKFLSPISALNENKAKEYISKFAESLMSPKYIMNKINYYLIEIRFPGYLLDEIYKIRKNT